MNADDFDEVPRISEVNSEVTERGIRLYGQDDALNDFPVLKAFQQYVDAEQSKARKRMLTLCIFFGILMIAVVSVFVMLLIRVGQQNQTLNDRLVEYVMKDRDVEKKSALPVVVQQPHDSAAILALTSKIDDLQKKLADDQAKAEKQAAEALAKAEKAIAEANAKAEKATADAAAAEKARQKAMEEAKEASKPKGPSPEELEIARLKALLAAEKERQAKAAEQEKERKRQEELEAYRRKHYPDYYREKAEANSRHTDSFDYDREPDEDEYESTPKPSKRPSRKRDVVDEIDEILKDAYESKSEKKNKPIKTVSAAESASPPAVALQPKATPQPEEEKEYEIPVEIKGSRTNWQIPED